MKIFKDLNPPQLDAVITTQGPLMILAGAGSGKTRVITRRIANLITQGIDPYRILAVTFTRKAANEMLERVEELVGPTHCWISTFHGIGLKMLKKYGHRIGVPCDFTICDADMQKKIFKDLYKLNNLEFDKYAITNITKFRDGDLDYLEYPLNDIYEQYKEKLVACKYVDFYGLLSKMVLLEDEVASQWDYVLVDEFQDTNNVQFDIVTNAVSRHGNICVVGDDDQSIYGWRGAKPEYLINFEKKFSNTKLIKLEQNYRSTGNIINGANAVIQNNKDRADKLLWTDIKSGRKIRTLLNENHKDEAYMILDYIKRVIKGGYRYKDVAILYRVNAQSLSFERMFKSNKIPFKLKGSLSFFARAEIKDVFAYLRLIVNKHSDLDIKRVINKPKRGIGKVTMKVLENTPKSLWDALTNPPKEIKNTTNIDNFVNIIEELTVIYNEGGKISKILKELIAYTSYLGYAHMNNEAGITRVSNIDALYESIVEYEEAVEKPNLLEYLQNVSIVDEEINPENPGDEVTLMTIHKAKGLEFPIVFIVGCSEGNMPIKSKWGMGSDLEEERRLMYVAMTRAQIILYLSVVGMPSPFIGEIPRDCIELKTV